MNAESPDCAEGAPPTPLETTAFEEIPAPSISAPPSFIRLDDVRSRISRLTSCGMIIAVVGTVAGVLCLMENLIDALMIFGAAGALSFPFFLLAAIANVQLEIRLMRADMDRRK
jgi:hypothetical protein